MHSKLLSQGRRSINDWITLIDTLAKRLTATGGLFLFLLTVHLLAQINIFDLEQPHSNVVVDRLHTDLNIEQIHSFGTNTDCIRCIFVLCDTDFYILDDYLLIQVGACDAEALDDFHLRDTKVELRLKLPTLKAI